MNRSLLPSLFLAASVWGCAESPAVDELSGETSADGEEGKGDSAAAFTYYELRADTRKCLVADGECGVGFYVSRPNRSTTQCGRGNAPAECKVYSIDWSGTAMPASIAKSYEDRTRSEHLIVRGTVSASADDSKMSLSVTEIWVGSSSEPGDGVFALVKDNGIRCVRAPCPSLTELKLNSNLNARLTGVDLDASGASKSRRDIAAQQVYGDGLIVVGYRDQDNLGGKTRTANTFYTRAPVPLH